MNSKPTSFVGALFWATHLRGCTHATLAVAPSSFCSSLSSASSSELETHEEIV